MVQVYLFFFGNFMGVWADFRTLRLIFAQKYQLLTSKNFILTVTRLKELLIFVLETVNIEW